MRRIGYAAQEWCRAAAIQTARIDELLPLRPQSDS